MVGATEASPPLTKNSRRLLIAKVPADVQRPSYREVRVLGPFPTVHGDKIRHNAVLARCTINTGDASVFFSLFFQSIDIGARRFS